MGHKSYVLQKVCIVYDLAVCLKRCADDFSSDEFISTRIFHQQMAIFAYISSFARVEKELV